MSKAAKWAVVGALVVALAAVTFALGVTFERNRGSSAASTATGSPDFDALYEIYGDLQRDYVDQSLIDPKALTQAAVNGMVKSLADTGTYYVDPTTDAVSVTPSGGVEGIGANVTQQTGTIVILSPRKGSPAEAAGVQAGDIILAVDGESTDGWNIDQAVTKIRGPKGSQVTLKLQHPNGDMVDLTITRDAIQVDSVSDEPPGGTLKDANGNDVTDLAYIQIREFSALTVSQLKPQVDQVIKAGYKGLIIDLRGNPGGLLDTVVQVADMFMDKGTILIEVDRDQSEKVYSAAGGGEADQIPIAILVNQYSASGSEVLSAALHDNGRATIIGEKTFGKGTVNRSEQLSDDRGALFVTVAKWLTPKRVGIDKTGITPDIQVSMTDQDIAAGRDPQLLRAIDFLHSGQ
ncbi:MAG: S41 family peptidase [Dehalococcoidia bacterium]